MACGVVLRWLWDCKFCRLLFLFFASIWVRKVLFPHRLRWQHSFTSMLFSSFDIKLNKANNKPSVALLEAIFISRADWDESVEAAKSRNNAG